MASKIRSLLAQRRKQLALLKAQSQPLQQDKPMTGRTFSPANSSPAISPARNLPQHRALTASHLSSAAHGGGDPFLNESPVLPDQRAQAMANGQHNPNNGAPDGEEAEHSDEEHHDDEEGEDTDREPIIKFRHVLSSLSSTRASISPDERRRLGRIYREFVSERSGDLPSGQAGTEIGGRATLM